MVNLRPLAWMAALSEESLNCTSKIVALVSGLQNKIDIQNSYFTDEMIKLKESFNQLRSDILATKNANNLLSGRLIQLERQCWANANYP